MSVKSGKIKANPALWLAGLAVFFLLFFGVGEENTLTEGNFFGVLKQDLAVGTAEAIHKQHLPIISFLNEQVHHTPWLVQKTMEDFMPIYGYSLGLEENADGYAVWQKEQEQQREEQQLKEQPMEEQPMEEQLKEEQEGENLEELLLAENREAKREQQLKEQQQKEQKLIEQVQTASEFVPHQLQAQVDLAALSDYEKLVKDFYTIDANTMAGNELLEVNKLLEKDMGISKEGEAPQILIYHTHSQETFVDSVPGDKSTSIVGVGAYLSEILTSRYGYKVLHHTGEYDVETRDDAYSVSLPAIEQLLLENPSIQVVIDLHRDQMPEETKLVMDLDGRPTARFMFFNGLSRTKKTGNISYLQNDNLADNLAFSFQMQLKSMQYYPGLTRKIYLKGYRYNMHLCPKTLLIELGAQNNTVEEVKNACEPIAHILDMVLSGQ